MNKTITPWHRASLVGLIAATALFSAVSSGQVPGMTVDQANDNFGYYYNNITSGWQSFTAGTNGRCGFSSGYDHNFHTCVITSDWAEEPNRDTSFTTASTVISNEAQLAQFAWLVNSSNAFAGQTLTLATNLDLSAHYWTP